MENFARRTTGGVVFVVGILMALAALGVQVGPMMAALGAGGFIVGFALQETLASFASGLMIMVYRPFDVDDYICVAGVEGTERLRDCNDRRASHLARTAFTCRGGKVV